MTIHREWYLFCDGSRRGFPCSMDGPYADGDARTVKPTSLRKSAQSEGWKRVGKHDYCAECASKIDQSEKGKE